MEKEPTDSLLDDTIAFQHVRSPGKDGVKAADDDRIGSKIGRFVLKERLGRGGYGDVYLASDESLRRTVAVKIINRGAVDESLDGLLEEGRTLAQLDHPGIVSVYDFGIIEDENKVYFVSQYVDGRPLNLVLKDQAYNHEQAAVLIARIAEALRYAHQRAIVHRDIKPSNIVITGRGDPVLIDFGIALSAAVAAPLGADIVLGSAGYMSPEQARGESHLVDGRTDIFSLGVILYEMLCGQRPFEGRAEDVIEQMASSTVEVRPLRQTDASIPRALERICLKALAKRTVDRYLTASDLASDLEDFINSSGDAASTDTQTHRNGVVIPKGLRSFTADDSEAFLKLLPGLRDQAGIPDSIRFWQRGIENKVDPFRVGVLYGPSGSGKSSFLRAGLLPRLSAAVEVIYIAAGSNRTEETLRERLQARASGSGSAGKTATDCLRTIREQGAGPGGRKLLIVIDQFEQWLHTRSTRAGEPDSDLLLALRQCDGRSVQVLLTVRDDFWMAIGRLMEDIDVQLRLSRNAAAIDLFDPTHARQVLESFGRAYERLPAAHRKVTAQNEAFLDSAIRDLQQGGKIIPLQLSLFVEMAKALEWTDATYRRIGGATAVGVEFLNSVFISPMANPSHRAIEKPARAILEALLPPGTERIRGKALGETELRNKAGLDDQEARCAATLEILDRELRLISPVDNEEERQSSDKSAEKQDTNEPATTKRRYQLTHDYLVPALRDWLFATRKNSAAGRSLLRLEELSAAWQSSRDRRHLPSFREWLSVHLLVPRRQRSVASERLMQAARRVHLQSCFVVVGVVSLLTLVGWSVHRNTNVVRLTERIVATPVETGMHPEARLQELSSSDRAAVIDRLTAGLMKEEFTDREALVARLALLAHEPDASYVRSLFDKLAESSPEGCGILCNSIHTSGIADSLAEEAWQKLSAADVGIPDKLRYSVLLARCDPESPQWEIRSAEVVEWILKMPSAEIRGWSQHFDQVHSQMVPLLEERLTNRSRPDYADATVLHPIAVALSAMARDRPEVLIPAYLGVADQQVGPIADAIAEAATAAVIEELKKAEASKGKPAVQRARAAALLLRILQEETEGENPHWQMLATGSKGAPMVRNYLIHQIPLIGVSPAVVIDQINAADDPELLHALILCLGDYPAGALSREQRIEIVEWARRTHTQTAGSGIHAATHWLLTEWGESLPEEVVQMHEPADKRRWYYNRTGMPFAIVDGTTDPDLAKFTAERYGIGMTEVTVGQYAEITGESTRSRGMGAELDAAVDFRSLNDGIRFCILLTRVEGLPEEEQCYREEDGQFVLVDDFFQKTGYRLPTYVEWRHAARGGDPPIRDWGNHSALSTHYAWTTTPRGPRPVSPVAKLKPNLLGLFDVLGNVKEWTHKSSVFDRKPHLVVDAYASGSNSRTLPVHLSIEDAYAHSATMVVPSHGFRIVRSLPAANK